MTVFDSSYISDLERRWRRRPESDWPLEVGIALQDFRDDDRRLIERCVAALHPDDQPKMIRQLRNQFVTTYGELRAAQALIDAGFQPRYEPSLPTETGVLTPDWYVSGRDTFVCDVFTAGLEKGHNIHETALRELEARLIAIPAPYFVAIEMANAASVDSGGRKKLANDVAQWLSSDRVAGETTSFGQLPVEVLAKGENHVDVLTMEPMQIIETPASIYENFDEKAKKYAPLGLPLLVIAVKHHRSKIDAIDVEDVVRGKLTFVSGTTKSGQVAERWERRPGGVFEKRRSLSAAMFVAPHKRPDPGLQIWPNPNADSPLPHEVLDRLSHARL